MKKTTIASALVAASLALGTAAAYAQAVSSSNPNAAGDVKSMPKDSAKAKDTSMPGGPGKVVSPTAAGDVKSKPKAPASAKDTSTGAYAGNPAPANPNAADDVKGKPTENGKTAKMRMSKNSKSRECTSTSANSTDCTKQ